MVPGDRRGDNGGGIEENTAGDAVARSVLIDDLDHGRPGNGEDGINALPEGAVTLRHGEHISRSVGDLDAFSAPAVISIPIEKVNCDLVCASHRERELEIGVRAPAGRDARASVLKVLRVAPASFPGVGEIAAWSETRHVCRQG